MKGAEFTSLAQWSASWSQTAVRHVVSAGEPVHPHVFTNHSLWSANQADFKISASETPAHPEGQQNCQNIDVFGPETIKVKIFA